MRVVLKLSGEALSGEGKMGYDPDMVLHVVEEIKSLVESGVEVGVVIGAGNLIRGRDLKGISRIAADHMGMLATVMNSIFLCENLKKHGLKSEVYSNFIENACVRSLNYEDVEDLIRKKGVPIFAGGTSNPLFTTDTAAALRAVEMGAKIILKGTKVDGVYDSDPEKNPNARRFEKLTFDTALSLGLEVMDLEAFSICRRFNITIVVYDFFVKGNSLKAVEGKVGTRVTGG